MSMNNVASIVATLVTTVGVTVGGVVAVDSKYIDEEEGKLKYQDRDAAEINLSAQIAVNTATTATLIDLRIQHYQFMSNRTTSDTERAELLKLTAAAQTEMQNLSDIYRRHSASIDAQVLRRGQGSPITTL